jgi:hypothetical protein
MGFAHHLAHVSCAGYGFGQDVVVDCGKWKMENSARSFVHITYQSDPKLQTNGSNSDSNQFHAHPSHHLLIGADDDIHGFCSSSGPCESCWV